MNAKLVQALEGIGGSRWQKNGNDRIYFNDLPEFYGLHTNHYNSGNVASATLNGETISNSKASKIIHDLSALKVWYDVTTDEFVFKGWVAAIAEQYATPIVAEIQRRAAEWESQHATI